MATSKRIDVKDLTRGAVIALPTDHPDAIHLHPNDYLAVKAGSIDYSRYLNSNPYAFIVTPNTLENIDIVEATPTVVDEALDIPSLADVESVVYEPYYDLVSKKQKVRALIKIRNSSDNPTNVAGVDARIFNPSTVVAVVTQPTPETEKVVTQSVQFVTPNPGIPQVSFKRDGTNMSWGWNNVSGLGSFTSVSYEWIISTTDSPSATSFKNGTISYTSSANRQIGTNGVMRTYRVSSRDGNLPATSSPRWLRVRTVVVGTNGTTYRSGYSTPI